MEQNRSAKVLDELTLGEKTQLTRFIRAQSAFHLIIQFVDVHSPNRLSDHGIVS